MRNIFFVCLIICLLGIVVSLPAQPFVPPPGSPLANGEHPRLFFTATSFQDIQNYVLTYESANFQAFVTNIDSYYPDDVTQKSRQELLIDAMNFSFLCYAVQSGSFSTFSFQHSAAEYAQKAYDHAVEIDFRVRNQGLEENVHAFYFVSSDGGYVNLALGVVYDWTHDFLNLTQKKKIADALIYLYTNRPRFAKPGKEGKLGAATALIHNAGVGGLTIFGDSLGIGYADSAQAMLNSIQEMWYDRVYLMGEHVFEGAGGWPEGFDRYPSGEQSIFWFTAALSSAIDVNLFSRFNWLKEVPKFLYFGIYPMKIYGTYQGYFLDRNNDTSLREWDSIFSLQQMVATTSQLKTSDPDYASFYKWVITQSDYQFSDLTFGNNMRFYWLFYKFLWGIEDIIPKSPDQVNLETSYRFGPGEIVLRSDHTTEAATKISFHAPKWSLINHKHKEEGSFTIWKYGSLAQDGGCGRSGGSLPKSRHTWAPVFHNSLVVYGIGAEGDSVYLFNSSVDGKRDAWYEPENQPGGRNHIGNIVGEIYKPGVFDYIDYDYTRAYKGENFMKSIRRKFLYIRDPNAPNYSDQEYVVVFDDMKLFDGSLERRWLLHTPDMPVILDGGPWNQVNSGFWTASSGATLKITNNYHNAHGRMFVKILAPNNYELRLRGGSDSGGDYWYSDANGGSLAQGIGGPYDDWAAMWVSKFRLEIEDLTGADSSQYLTVIHFGDSNTLTSMASVDPINTGNFSGSLINQDRLVLFNKTSAPLDSVSYSFTSNKTVWHIIDGLVQGNYYIRVNGSLISGTNFVDENGVLYFEYDNGGSFSISRHGDTIPPSTPTNLRVEP